MIDDFLSRLTFGPQRSLCVAVSGGGDSMALLVAAHDWSVARGKTRLTALTVDHGLRPEAAGEAAAVGAFCAARGIAHRTLVWEGEKPGAGISAAARDARHDLLARAAQEAGAEIVLTGHTLDDQAETVAMRAARGSGRGEAGIAEATLFMGSTWFVRPMLGLRREALRDFLREHGIGWADDPSNDDPAYERARVRASLGESERVAAVERARQASAERQALGEGAAAIIAAHGTLVAPGLLRLDPAALAEEGGAADYALRILLSTVGGQSHLVDAARARALRLRCLDGDAFRLSLSGALVERSRHGIFLHREARNLAVNELGDTACDWDGRYRVPARGHGNERLMIGPAGEGGPDAEIAGISSRLLRGAAAAEPSLRRVSDARAFATAEAVAGASFTPLVAPWARHLPCFDLAPAAAMARLIGAPPIPPTPLLRHIHMT